VDTVNGELIDWSAVFRDKPDPTTLQLRVGCGGCFSQDSVPADELTIDYGRGVIEPFTQSVYRPFDDGEDGTPARQFDASLLSLASCPDRHFTVVLDVLDNATGPVYWSPVVGRGESFTLEELSSFGDYLLNVHGSAWTNLSWTVWVNLLVAILLISVGQTIAYRSHPASDRLRAYRVLDAFWYRFAQDPRELLYDLAMTTYVWSILEKGSHWVLAVAQDDVHIEPFAIFGTWLLVIGFADGLMLWITITAWKSLYVEDRRVWWVRADIWAPGEILTGLSFAILFGSGLGFGPWLTVLAGIVRLRETEFARGILESKAGVSPLEAGGKYQSI
jgi:hypothetical protein